MMRTGFPGYGSAPALETIRRPARSAGATRSLAAERRFKRTDGASGRDLQSSIRPALVFRYDDARRCRHGARPDGSDRKSTRLNSSHLVISYAVFCLKKKK